MSDKKSLPSGDKAAVLLSANSTCYAPTCSEPLIVYRDASAIVNFEYAHIRDELPPKDQSADIGWRYFPDADLTQEQRNHHSNIILLCSPCHKLVDKIKPRDFDIATLTEWKSSAESSSPPLPAVLGGLDLELLQSLVGSAVPPERSFPFVDYRIFPDPSGGPTNPVVTPLLQVCGTTTLRSHNYHISISKKTINIFNPELAKSSKELVLTPGTHSQLQGFPLQKCWDDGATPFLTILVVLATDKGTFSQNTTVSVTPGIPTIKTHNSSVSFSDGSQSTSALIYTRNHDTTGKSVGEKIHIEGWAANASLPLYSHRL